MSTSLSISQLQINRNRSIANNFAHLDIASLRVAILGLGGLGGSGKVATELAQGLATAGASVSLLSSPQPQWAGDRHPDIHFTPVSVPRIPTAPSSDWIEPLADEIVKQVVANQTAVLSVHYAVGLVEAALLARQVLAKWGQSLAVCLTLHGSDVTNFGQDSTYRPRLRELIMACDRVTAVSHWLADRAVEIFDLSRRPTVIHNAINLELFQPVRTQNKAATGKLTLCHVSNFRPVKRPLDAVAVLARLRGAGVPAQLVMVGDGPLVLEAREYASDLNTAHDVIFAGTLSPSELVHQFSMSDLLLVTSESESFCLAALEAMACGVPVIGTHCGGLEEVMVSLLGASMTAQLLSQPGDVVGMAAKGVQMLQPSTYQWIQEQCLATIELCFSRAAQLQAYGYLFNRLQQEVGR